MPQLYRARQGRDRRLRNQTRIEAKLDEVHMVGCEFAVPNLYPRNARRYHRAEHNSVCGIRMSLNFVLVPGPLVRVSSWEPTAEALRKSGHAVQIPDVLDDQSSPPAWRDWTTHLLQRIMPCGQPILVGHSSASALVADLAPRLTCSGVIIVDGEVPPSRGAAAPVRPALLDFIRSLAAGDGKLPIWSRWFAGDLKRASLVGLDLLARDPIAFAEFERGLPTLSVEWFDDTIELAGWDHVPAGFIQCSPIYDHAMQEAQRRGWPVIRLEGTHLHPTLAPAETAHAILFVSGKLRRLAV
jgi:Alpha/beta hydrolase family